MNTNKLVKNGVFALALSLSAGAYAQNTEDKGRATDSDLGGRTIADWPGDPGRVQTSGDLTGSVSKANKASSLIGMDVRNAQDERLGEIKDLVVDLNSGKISYAVLSVGGFLGIGDKFIAVPPSAFSLSDDQDRLVLNADKAKIENAPSFAKNDWPALNSPELQTSYWMPESTAVGTPAPGAFGTGSSSSQAQPDSDLNRGSSSRIESDRSPSDDSLRSSSSSRVEGDRSATARDTFRGRITAIDPQKRTMTVEGPSGSRHFQFDDRPTITLKDSRNPRISDLKVGFPVVVGYHQQGGNYIADNVLRSDTPEVR
jgi:sporulation protein YlmC with PRC-barrel domain